MNVLQPQWHFSCSVCLHPELMECKKRPIKPLKIDQRKAADLRQIHNEEEGRSFHLGKDYPVIAQRAHNSRREENRAKLVPLISSPALAKTHGVWCRRGIWWNPFAAWASRRPSIRKKGRHGKRTAVENGCTDAKRARRERWSELEADEWRDFCPGRSRRVKFTRRRWNTCSKPETSAGFNTNQLQQQLLILFLCHLSKLGKWIHKNIQLIPAYNCFNYYTRKKPSAALCATTYLHAPNFSCRQMSREKQNLQLALGPCCCCSCLLLTVWTCTMLCSATTSQMD